MHLQQSNLTVLQKLPCSTWYCFSKRGKITNHLIWEINTLLSFFINIAKGFCTSSFLLCHPISDFCRSFLVERKGTSSFVLPLCYYNPIRFLFANYFTLFNFVSITSFGKCFWFQCSVPNKCVCFCNNNLANCTDVY